MKDQKIGGNTWVRVNGLKKEIVHPTIKETVKEDGRFQSACAKAGIEPTARQASKWRNQKGKAFANR